MDSLATQSAETVPVVNEGGSSFALPLDSVDAPADEHGPSASATHEEGSADDKAEARSSELPQENESSGERASNTNSNKKRKAVDSNENNEVGASIDGHDSEAIASVDELDSEAVTQLEPIHRHMLHIVGQPISDVPPKRGRQGAKGYAPTGTAEDRDKLAAARADWCTLATSTRVVSIRALSTGVWRPDVSGAPGAGVVELTVMRGSHFKSLGHHCKQRRATVLAPEEALFLMDRGALEVWCGGVPLTLAEAYAVLLPHDMPVMEMTVYLHLRRLGYVVHRSTASATPATNPSPQMTNSSFSTAETAGEGVAAAAHPHEHPAPATAAQTTNSSPTSVPGRMLSAFWGGVSTFLSKLTAPFSGAKARPGSPKEGVAIEEHDVAAILRPHDCTTFDAVYERLRAVSMKPVALHDYAVDTHRRLKIALDVYKMRPTFKKSDPGLPDFRVCVCDFTDEAPTLMELRQLTADADPAVLKFAVVHGGTISWYGILDLALPVYADHRMMGFQSQKSKKSKQRAAGAAQSHTKKRRVYAKSADTLPTGTQVPGCPPLPPQHAPADAMSSDAQ